MLFNSVIFIIFFVIFYIGYLYLKNDVKKQNAYILVASYIFYGSWSWKFCLLILLSTVVDFWCASSMDKDKYKNKRKQLLLVSAFTNLGILFFFKYFNFFTSSFIDLFSIFGIELDHFTVNVILPVGISFYTFQTMSYTIDVYREKIKHEKSLLNFAVYVAFFPQLVAGPIERASSLLPQIIKPRKVTSSLIEKGIWLIVLGYFKKVVIADNFAVIADEVFNSPGAFEGLNIILGILAFTFQIYGDFSGYSDIARGISNLMGFDLIINFNVPYISRSPSEFWRRWHISLSQWLRDYLYIGLGGNRGTEFNVYRNLFITMFLGGLWHGAAWNFILWGVFHGSILIIYRYFNLEKTFVKNYRFTSLVVFFLLTCFGWVLFRINSLADLNVLMTNLMSVEALKVNWLLVFIALLPMLFFVQYFKVKHNNLYYFVEKKSSAKYFVYTLLFIYIFVFGKAEVHEFIYFQF